MQLTIAKKRHENNENTILAINRFLDLQLHGPISVLAESSTRVGAIRHRSAVGSRREIQGSPNAGEHRPSDEYSGLGRSILAVEVDLQDGLDPLDQFQHQPSYPPPF